MPLRTTRSLYFLLGTIILAGVAPVAAVDGVVLIDQNRALAGNVTPGDTPGFPVTISLSGSYRLSGNLTVPNENTTAIDITGGAGAVSIDLNGFAILGPTLCDASIPPVCAPIAADPANIFGPGVGIRSQASGTLTVRNGSIRGMGRFAVFVSGAPLVIVDGLHARDGGRGGVFLGIANVFNSTVSRNGGHGITINQGVVKGNLVTRNGGVGILSTGFPLTVLDNQIGQNSGAGIDFASTGSYGNNTIYSNLGGHISGSGIQVSGNVCGGVSCP
jgi:Right handed beta helix region